MEAVDKNGNLVKRNLSERFVEFAADVIKLGHDLNKLFEGGHVYRQLFRSSTGAGANYEESQSGESRKDFIHKLQISLKELKEPLYWLRLTKRLI